MANYKWSEQPITYLASGSNPDRNTEHRYLTRVLWDAATINTVAFEWHNGQQRSKIRLIGYTVPQSVRTPYVTGDKLWIPGCGEYTVTDTDLNDNVWIDADYNEVAAVPYGTTIYRTRAWRVAEPGRNRYGATDSTASVDIAPVMSTLLAADYFPTFTPSVLSTGRGYLRYLVITGSEAPAEWSFDDNQFSGSVAFVSNNTAASPFIPGDQVVIQQQQTAWNYVDNVFISSSLAFTGSTYVPFPVNSQIYVTGQTIQPAYNGVTSVAETASRYLVTGKTWLSDTAVDGGTIYGYERPEYNRTATVINTFVSASKRWVVTDIPWAGNSSVTPGKMVSATNTKHVTWSAINTGNVTQINLGDSKYPASDFVISGYDGAINNYSSIIARQDYQHPVQTTDSGYLLATPSVDYDGTDLGIQVQTYDAAGNPLFHAEGLVQGYSPDPETAYAYPYGLKDLETLFGQPLISDAVATYTIQPYADQDTDVFGDPVTFRIHNECIGLEPYCVMWRDSQNSITSFPFNFVSTISDSFERAFWNPQPHVTETLNTITNNTMRLNSAFIRNANEDAVIGDLLSATEVWVKSSTELIPVNVTNSEYNYGNRQYGDLPSVTLEVTRRTESIRK
jgi:hypothetical protein